MAEDPHPLSGGEPSPREHDQTRTLGDQAEPAASPSSIPQAIAGYTIVGKLGEGGMGVVYEAEQRQPRRRVALKVVRGGQFVDELYVKMFQREAEALARLKHPNIGGIYESGCTEDGQHFFAMELIHGESLDIWLKRNSLDGSDESLEKRLRMIATIADAVHYAHQRGVIHRDLKPSNIVVTAELESNASGSAARAPGIKILDFGLARMTDADVAATQVTEVGVIKGTLSYMSPEQTRGDAAAIDVRSDVYAIGVILYEMLTGSRPYDLSGSLMEAVKVICEQAPRPLQEKWKGPRKLDPDIETIASKALAKDPDMRYASAAALSEDIHRFLTSQPILARPPSTIYQLRKLVSRNRLATSLAASMLLLLVGFGVAVSALYARSLAAEATATREAETARQALGFMTEMFEVSDPSESRGETVTAREILDRGAARIERELADQPAIRSTLMANMGQVYGGLGLYSQAETLLGTAASTQNDVLGPDHPESMRTSKALADVLSSLARFPDAEAQLRQTIARQERVLGAEHEDVLESKTALARVLELRSQYEEAESIATPALATAQRTLGSEHPLSLELLNQLALIYQAQARFEEAEQQFLKVREARRSTLGDDHPDALTATNNLADLYMSMGRFDESEALFEEGLQTLRKTFGEEHRDTLLYQANLGRLYGEQYRWEEAEAVYRSILDVQRRTLGDDHRDTLLSLNTLGVFLANQGRSDEAELFYLESLDGLRRLLGEKHKETLATQGNVAMHYLQVGQMDKALEMMRTTYEQSIDVLGKNHPTTALYLENYANVIFRGGDHAKALEMLYEVRDAREQGLGVEHPAVTRTMVNLSVVHGIMGDEEGASKVQEELFQRAKAGIGADYPAVAQELNKLIRKLIEEEAYAAATERHSEVIRIRRKMLGDDHAATLASLRGAVKLAVLAKRWDDAETAARECIAAHEDAPSEEAAGSDCATPLIEALEDDGQTDRARTIRESLAAGA